MAILAMTTAAVLAFSAAPAAPQTVEVTIIHAGGYRAAVCAMDVLEGRCDYDVRTGQSREFTVHPRRGEPISARVVPTPMGGGSDEISIVTKDTRACFKTGGSRKQATIEQVSCEQPTSR